jgi:glycosyltransferase involved in cell wall biosynthesis
MNAQPLVSVICLCHNQARFVDEAIQSVWDQNHSNIELIVVDDGSTDSSKAVIQKELDGSKTQFIDLKENIGNCRAFNHGLKEAKGSFIIDLAADDILYPNRITEGIKSFSDKKIGVNFCDVRFLNDEGENLGSHYKRNETGELVQTVPEGEIYKELISRYFISPPSMMMRKSVLDELGGYDENLSYEDFDFWIRSSRNWRYNFTDQLLVGKRIVGGSLSSKQFQFRTKHQRSTLAVCKKIKKLNRSKEEDLALKKRCWYEVRQCFKQGNLELTPGFLKLI